MKRTIVMALFFIGLLFAPAVLAVSSVSAQNNHRVSQSPPKLQVLKRYKFEGDVDLVSINQSGKVAATFFGQDYGTQVNANTLRLWNTDNFAQIGEYKINCRDICFGKDDYKLLIVDPYGIKELDIRTGKIEMVLEGEFYKAAYNPKDNDVIFYSDELDAYYYRRSTLQTVFLHNATKGSGVMPFRHYHFTQDHLQIAMCRNYTLQIDLKDYSVKKMYFSEDDNCRVSLSASADEKFFIEEAGFGIYRLYDHQDYIRNGQAASHRTFRTGNINSETFNFLDERYALWGTINGRSVEIWDLKELKKVSSFAQKGKLSYVSSITFHPDKRLIVVGSLYGILYFFRY